MLYEETFNSGKLAFNGINYYWVDPKGRVIKTEQNIHPKLPKVIIEFYFKQPIEETLSEDKKTLRYIRVFFELR